MVLLLCCLCSANQYRLLMSGVKGAFAACFLYNSDGFWQLSVAIMCPLAMVNAGAGALAVQDACCVSPNLWSQVTGRVQSRPAVIDMHLPALLDMQAAEADWLCITEAWSGCCLVADSGMCLLCSTRWQVILLPLRLVCYMAVCDRRVGAAA